MPKLHPALRLGLALVLLSSIGGAGIYTAPILIPLFLWAARQSGALESWGWALLSGLTLAEVGWFFVFISRGEDPPEIWLLPLLLGAVGLIGVKVLARQARSQPA